MAPVEIDHVPRSIIAPVKNMKVVDKAMSLPLVSSAYSEGTRVTSPYMESTYNKVSPVVETTMGMVSPMVDNVKTKVEEQVIPHIPTKITETVLTVQNYAIDNVTAAVEKVDHFACGGIDQLTEKVPQLKDATPKLIEETKSSVTTYVTGWTDYFASFSLSQVALKVVDSSLDLVDGALNKIGSEETGTVRTGVRMVHFTANTIRLDAVKKAGSEKAKKIEEASIIGALLEVSGLQDLLAMFGFKLKTSDRREYDEAYGVTAISDQNKFRKKVRTNLQPFITFGQQRTAVLEDDERKDVFVSPKIFFLGGVIVFFHVIDVVKIVNRFVSIILVGVVIFIQCGIVKVILKGIVKIKKVEM